MLVLRSTDQQVGHPCYFFDKIIGRIVEMNGLEARSNDLDLGIKTQRKCRGFQLRNDLEVQHKFKE